ncbi:Rab9 effector protein with kelch motifs, partial [Frankliniella fusca]
MRFVADVSGSDTLALALGFCTVSLETEMLLRRFWTSSESSEQSCELHSVTSLCWLLGGRATSGQNFWLSQMSREVADVMNNKLPSPSALRRSSGWVGLLLWLRSQGERLR